MRIKRHTRQVLGGHELLDRLDEVLNVVLAQGYRCSAQMRSVRTLKTVSASATLPASTSIISQPESFFVNSARSMIASVSNAFRFCGWSGGASRAMVTAVWKTAEKTS